MRKFLLFFITGCVILCGYSCNTTGGQKSKKVAKGNRVYGGTLHINERSPLFELYPYNIFDNVSYAISCQVYDGLVKLNPQDLSIVPDIARSWDIDSSGTLYTFHLRQDAIFQDDPCFPNGKGRKVTAKDFQYSFEELCTSTPDNVTFAITFKDVVAGADEYFEESKKGKPSSGISGVKIINDSTLQIKLIKKNPAFLNMIAGPGGDVIAQEAVEKYGKGLHLGTGPFIYSQASDTNRVILTANPNYFRRDSLGNQLPYLDSVVISFISDRKEEFKAFQKGKLDYLISVPSSQVDKMVEGQIADFQNTPPKYVLSRVSVMSTQMYAFNITKAPFNNEKVRKAFSLAIDRNKIVNEVLQGEAFAPGLHGVTPPSFMNAPNPEDNYDISTIKGDSLNVDLAKKLLSEAGYPDGKNFPSITLELDNGGGLYTSVAVEVQKELLNNLNVKINLNIVPFARELEDERYGKYEMIRTGWLADYANPIDFLTLFLSSNVPDSGNQPSYYNISRYKNPEYDELVEKGLSAKTVPETYQYYKQAEQLIVNDAPVIVLWYDQNYSLTRWQVKDFYPNSLNYLDMSCVYIDTKIPHSAKSSSTKKK